MGPPWWTDQRGGRTDPSSRPGSRDADGLGAALGDRAVHVLPVVGPAAGGRGDRPRDPVRQRTGLGAVVRLVAGQLRGLDPPGLRVHAEVQLAPGAPRLRAVLLDQPLAGP